ncbi:MAG: Ig domain protein group 2 domain protein [Firmicutes bacterium]|nr:Ig domain protein group 2 domain protein [Bacillota bacterium]
MVELEYYSNLFKIISTIYMKEMEQLKLKAKIILTGISLLIMTFLFTPQLIYAADENPDKVVETITKTWTNPYYVDIQEKLLPVKSLQPMGVTAYTAANMTELESVLYQAFTNRETYPQVTYTGPLNTLGEVDEYGNLLNLNGLSNLINSITNEDDYLKFNIVKLPYSVLPGETSSEISFINNTDPENPAYISYLTTLAQENDVDVSVTNILSIIIDAGMNPHQIVKAIHDYIVLNVAYDTTLVEHSAYAALYGEKKTVCQGYSLLAYKMLEEAGLQARIIGGTAGGGAHAWNLVEIEGKWYYLDCTWDDPVTDKVGQVLYNYYNLTDTEINLDHKAYAEYDGLLPAANISYADTLNTQIALGTDQSDTYVRLRQQLQLDYLLFEKTAENETELRNMIQTNITNHNSACSIRYYIGSTDISTALNRVGEIIQEISPYVGYGLSASRYTRGGLTGYIIVNMNFTYSTTNQAPTASSLEITGKLQPGESVSGIYNYNDTENDKKGLSQFEWYRGASADGSDKTLIPGAIGSVYTVQNTDVGKYLFFRVCPAAVTGTLSGVWSDLSIACAQVKLASTALTAGQVMVTNNATGTSDVINITGLHSGDEIRVYSSLTTETPFVTGKVPTDQTTLQLSTEQLGTGSGTLYISVQNIDKNESTCTAISYIAEAGTDECFIATAAFGSKFIWPVALLRHFRDQYLLTNDLGKAFVNFYYRQDIL